MSNFLTRFWENISGQPHSSGAPENEILQKILSEWETAALGKGKDFGHQVITESNKAGLPPESLQYVFWVLVEQSRTWNLSGTARRALILARDLMVRSDRVPAYNLGFQKIPAELEDQVDQVISRMSLWAQGVLVAGLKADLMKAAERHKRPMARILKRHDGLEGKTLVYIYQALQGAVVTEPGWFKNPDLMQPLLSSVL
jgi:hypothetical protein